MERTIEKRQVKAKVEVRATDVEGQGNTLFGYAAKFGELSEDLGGFREIIRPGAFMDTLVNGDIRALYNHNHDYVLGRTKSGTLRLTEDEIGLRFEVDLGSSMIADLVRDCVGRGDIDGCSFGFCVIEDVVNPPEDGELPLRELIKVELIEISPAVAWPAYSSTEVDVRSLAKINEAKPRSKTPWLDDAREFLKQLDR